MGVIHSWPLSIGIVAILLSASAGGAQAPCDPSLLPESNPTIKYRQRTKGLRCEGFYKARVTGGASSLDVVGLLQRPLRLGSDGEVLRVNAVVADRPVRVRGQGIPVKLYYRLDAELEPGDVLEWPADLLHDQGVAADEVGLFGTLADREDWYVPLDVRGSDPPRERPHLLLRASVDVNEILWRHARGKGEGCGRMPDWNELTVPKGFAGGEAIPVDLPESDSRRLCLEVAARTRRDGDWLKRLVRIHR